MNQQTQDRQKILILASKLGYQTRGFSDAAERLGLEVFFGTDRCHKLDDPWGDGALPLNFSDAQAAGEEIFAEFREHPPTAILALGDRPTAAAAYASRALGLPGNPPKMVEACNNKLRQREILKAAHLPVPDFLALGPEEDLMKFPSRVEFPCVLKPLELSASQGVIRANNKEEFRSAVSRIRSLLASPEVQPKRNRRAERLLVERYIPGDEFAMEALLTDGELRALAIFDKPDPLEGPYFEETIYVTPSRLPADQQAALRECAERAVRALGLITGPIHAEFRISGEVPWILEIAPRPIGGLCSRALAFAPEKISLEELLIRHALGFDVSDVKREECASGVMMIPVPRSGIFERAEGIEDAGKIDGVVDVRITARLRDYVAAWPEGSSYLGFIFAKGDSPERVETTLRDAHAKLRFVFSPRLPVEHPVTGKMPANG